MRPKLPNLPVMEFALPKIKLFSLNNVVATALKTVSLYYKIKE